MRANRLHEVAGEAIAGPAIIVHDPEAGIEAEGGKS
jgi:hypothetical protein